VEEKVASPRERFARIARSDDVGIDLAEAALLVAAEEYPALDVPAYLARLDQLAAGAARRVPEAGEPRARLQHLIDFLGSEQGFAGDREEYEDPRNSFLNEVLDRGKGLPITLWLVYREVARRLGLAIAGVSFPGHFLGRVEAAPALILDAFGGRMLGLAECEKLLQAALGAHARLVPEVHLCAATPRQILVRMLSNLKLLYVRRSDYPRALACCERILLLTPDAPAELRDRGIVYEQLECFSAALADLRRSLELAPGDEAAPAVRVKIEDLAARVRRFH
jgi:regulator of sirC expression with transglutaminase-like and TPR domain